jgi:hypothetical protein
MSKRKIDRETFLHITAKTIEYYAGWFEDDDGKDVLPEGYKPEDNEGCEKGVPSLGQMVAVLNDNQHGTIFNNKWTRHSLKLILEELEEKGVKLNVGHKKCKTIRANIKRSCNADKFAMEVYEDHLKYLDVESMTNSELARQLDKRGSKTKKGNRWSPAGCGHLRARLKKME